LVRSVLPRLRWSYADHLATAAPVSEAPVMEVLDGALRVLDGELHDAKSLFLTAAGPDDGVAPGLAGAAHGFERAFEGSGILPAVWPS
jgi:hypothetical protein